MENTELCNCHKKHEEKFHVIEQVQSDRKYEIKDLWHELDRKCPMSLFLFLVALMISNLAFQWGIYSNLKELDKKVAVIEANMKSISNSSSCNKLSFYDGCIDLANY